MIRKISYFGSVILTATSVLWVNYIYSQKLSVEDYGLFSLIVAGIGITVSIFMFGQATAISVIFFSPEKKNCQNISRELFLSLIIILKSFVFFSCIGIYIWYANYDKNIQITTLIMILFAALAYTLQLFFISLINCMDRYQNYLVGSFIGASVMICVSSLIPTIYGYLIAVIACGLSHILIFMPSIKQAFKKNALKTSKVFGRLELIRIGWVAIPGMIIASLAAFIDKYLLSKFLSFEQVGVYSLAFIISVGVGRVFISALLKSNSILLFQSLQEDNIIGIRKILKKTELTLCALCLIAVILYYSIGKELLIITFGVKYEKALPYMLILFIAVMVEGMMQFIAQILIQKRKLFIVVINGAWILLISIIFNYIFIPNFLIQGAVLTLLLCNFIALIAVNIQIKNITNQIEFPLIFTSTALLTFVISFLCPIK